MWSLFTSIAVLAALVTRTFQQEQVKIQIAGDRDPFGGKRDEISPNVPISAAEQVLVNVSYSLPIETHVLNYAEEGFIMAEVQVRGSQKIILCINKGVRCDTSPLSAEKQMTIIGTAVDIEGAQIYDNILHIAKPPGADYILTIFFLNERVEGSNSVLSLTSKTSNDPASKTSLACTKCEAGRGKCQNGTCICADGYFGRICNRYVKRMDSDSTSLTRSLKQFESVSIDDMYEKGDKTTYFTIQSAESPSILFILNENSRVNYGLLYREDRGSESTTSVIDTWDSTKKSVQLKIEKDWAGASIINLSPRIAEVTFSMTSSLAIT